MPEEKDLEIRRMVYTEWRELGFHYDLDQENKTWIFTGSKKGILKFVALLRKYTEYSSHKKLSEHCHYGPYKYLKIMTWNEPDVSERDIRGTLPDLARLATLIEKRVNTSAIGDVFRIGEEFSNGSDYILTFTIMNDNFDPASIDIDGWFEIDSDRKNQG